MLVENFDRHFARSFRCSRPSSVRRRRSYQPLRDSRPEPLPRRPGRPRGLCDCAGAGRSGPQAWACWPRQDGAGAAPRGRRRGRWRGLIIAGGVVRRGLLSLDATRGDQGEAEQSEADPSEATHLWELLSRSRPGTTRNGSHPWDSVGEPIRRAIPSTSDLLSGPPLPHPPPAAWHEPGPSPFDIRTGQLSYSQGSTEPRSILRKTGPTGHLGSPWRIPGQRPPDEGACLPSPSRGLAQRMSDGR